LEANKKVALPIRVFEVGDVVFQDPQSERRARNERHLCALYASKASGLEYIHGLLDRIMAMMSVPMDAVKGYAIKPSSSPTFFPGRQADVLYQGKTIGSFGIVHPDVLEDFNLIYPCSVLEMNIEPFM
jgi:phenylalanyl-tRNA synthetase beta chain